MNSLLQTARSVTFASSREQLIQLSFAGKDNSTFDVSYDVPGKGEILEANLTYCKNGVVVNYPEDYMRRRDPASMLIGDNNDTDKPSYKNEYGKDFDGLRQETLDWLKEEDLVVVCFKAGGYKFGYDALLIPNQHIGVYYVGFNPQWVAREYIARRGSAKFKPEHLIEARCSLLGFTLDSLKVDGQYVRRAFLQPERQQEVGHDGYDKGAEILLDFFKKEASQFNTPELDPLGRQIIECLLRDAPLQDYLDLLPMRY